LTYTKAGDIATELYARLSRIRIAAGFETEVGRDVKRGRRKLPGDDAPPCIVMFEGDDSPTDRPGRIPLVLVQQSYVFDAFDKCDPDNPNDQAHKMIRDMKRAIFAGDATLGGRVSRVSYLGRDIGPRPDGVALVQARVMIDVEYVEDLTNP
jgi:hypothetical protein